jgi:hypothetical protein
LPDKEDLLFAMAVLGNEGNSSRTLSILNEKINMYEDSHRRSPDCLIPTTVMEEKLMNPYLNADKFAGMLGVKGKDRTKCFDLLRSMRKEWRKPTEPKP